jgi:ribosomal protein L7/L12
VVSYSVLGAAVMIAFSLGVLIGRRDPRRQQPGGTQVGARSRAKGIGDQRGSEAEATPARYTLSAQDAVLDAELREHLEHGRMISAIKRYRDLTGVGLREAKQAIEALR